jgi:starch-binding outer membrane protein, SusD/RagB family
MKTPNHFFYIISLVFVSLFIGCQELDYDEATGNDKDEVFSDFARSKNFVTGIYAYLPLELNFLGSSLRAAATDEAEEVDLLSDVQKFNEGSWSALQTLDNVWLTMYDGIRASNVFLKEFENQKFLDLQYTTNYKNLMLQYNNLSYEVRFLRAFFYFELIKRYKDVPLITTVLTPDEAANVKESKFNELVEFIVKECDAVSKNDIKEKNLPITYIDFANLNETGRATRGAAIALKARALLYAASPLHNPHPVGTEENKALWIKAALAAKEVIDLKNGTSPVYSLGNYNSIVNNIASSELIFERREGLSNTFERRNFPMGVFGGRTGICPSQNLVDAYEMQSTGLPITDISSRYSRQQPYTGRDSRLGLTIITNNSFFKSVRMEMFFGGINAKPILNATKTGYYLRKYVVETIDFNQLNPNSFAHVWVFFRYGEILLNYAEAMNEAYGPYSIGSLPVGSMTAQDAVNFIRRRAQMPNFPAGMSQVDFGIKLRNERRVELAFEDHRFWDVRRWKIGDQTKDIYAMKITGTKALPVYESVLLEKRIYEDKMNFYPKPQSELIRNTNLKQNPGW